MNIGHMINQMLKYAENVIIKLSKEMKMTNFNPKEFIKLMIKVNHLNIN